MEIVTHLKNFDRIDTDKGERYYLCTFCQKMYFNYASMTTHQRENHMFIPTGSPTPAPVPAYAPTDGTPTPAPPANVPMPMPTPPQPSATSLKNLIKEEFAKEKERKKKDVG